jgi:hypothetical protein
MTSSTPRSTRPMSRHCSCLSRLTQNVFPLRRVHKQQMLSYCTYQQHIPRCKRSLYQRRPLVLLHTDHRLCYSQRFDTCRLRTVCKQLSLSRPGSQDSSEESNKHRPVINCRSLGHSLHSEPTYLVLGGGAACAVGLCLEGKLSCNTLGGTCSSAPTVCSIFTSITCQAEEQLGFGPVKSSSAEVTFLVGKR